MLVDGNLFFFLSLFVFLLKAKEMKFLTCWEHNSRMDVKFIQPRVLFLHPFDRWGYILGLNIF